MTPLSPSDGLAPAASLPSPSWLAAPPSKEEPAAPELGRGLPPPYRARRHHAAADWNSIEWTHANRPSATAVSTRTSVEAS